MHAFDRQTDGRTDRQTPLSLLDRSASTSCSAVIKTASDSLSMFKQNFDHNFYIAFTGKIFFIFLISDLVKSEMSLYCSFYIFNYIV